MNTVQDTRLRAIYWRDGHVELLDQTRLPREEVWLELSDYREVIAAIRDMRIRGAPAIGVAGAYAVALAAREIEDRGDSDFIQELEQAAEAIRHARPTGANLAWAVRRMMAAARSERTAQFAADTLAGEAQAIQEDDERANMAIGRLGAGLLPRGGSVLTHCNAGALATGGYGTALGVIRQAWSLGRLSHVYATETRPLLQGARLTAWELVREGIDATLIPDSAAGSLMQAGQVQTVVVGADRIAANGDVANKIGTYSLAVLAKANGVAFYVAAPTSTIDLATPSGEYIPIEERSAQEVVQVGDTRIAPDGIGVMNPAFDVTPHALVAGIITERGVARGPYDGELERLVETPVG